MVVLNSTLSEQEKRNYIRQSDGNLFVEAGAGAGKTTFISKRIINQMKKGVRPQEFVFITFTNEAMIELYEKIEKNIVREMKKASSMEELSQLAYALEQLPEMNIMTIYRFCYGILVQAGKADGIREADFVSSEGMNHNNRNITKRCRKVLEEDAEFLCKVRKRFRHIYVDEFQDTDENQAAVLLLLAGEGEEELNECNNYRNARWLAERTGKPANENNSGSEVTAVSGYDRPEEKEIEKSDGKIKEMDWTAEDRGKEIAEETEPEESLGVIEKTLSDKEKIGEILAGNPSTYQIRDDALFFVGDARQSIYRDEGAEVGIFCKVRDYMCGLKNAELISLEENYRSEEEILDWINSCFEKGFENYTAMKGDWAVKDKASFHGVIKVCQDARGRSISEKKHSVGENNQEILILPADCGRENNPEVPHNRELGQNKNIHVGMSATGNDNAPVFAGENSDKAEKDRSLLISLIRTLFRSKACYLEEKDAGTVRNFIYSDFLVLVMREENIKTYVDALTEAGIPAITTGKFSIEKNENAVRVMTLKKAKGLAGNIVIVADRSMSRKEYFDNIGETEDFSEWKRLEYVTATRARHALIFLPELCDDTEFSDPGYGL